MTATTIKTEEENTTYRGPSELFERMNQFVEQASPALREKMAEATLATNGKARGPRASNVLRFLDYAINLALNFEEEEKKTPAASPRFGVRIEQDVQEIIAHNRAAYAENPAAWENLTAIGSTLLRAKGHNPTSIAKWLAQNEDMIAAHHAEIGITDPTNHNRKAGKARSLRK